MKNYTFFKTYLQYASAGIFGMLAVSCYILADTFFIAQGLGAQGLAALNLAIPVFNFIHGSGLMLGMGGAICFSIYQGQGKDEQANCLFVNTLYLSAAVAGVFILLGLLGSASLTSLLGADAEIFDQTHIYLRTLLFFSPAFILNDVFTCFVRNDGGTRLAMTAMIVGSLSNIVLDYILIFPLQMGIFGAVLATGVSPVVGLLVLLVHRKRKKNHFHLIRAVWQAKMSYTIFALGFSSFISEFSSGIVIVVFNLILFNLQGNVGVAAYGVVANLSLIAIAVWTGLAQGMQPLISRAHARDDQHTLRQILRYAVITVVLMSSVIYAAVLIGSDSIVLLFNSERNPHMQAIASSGLRLYMIGMVFAGLNLSLTTYFSAVERARPAQILSILRGLVLIVPAAYILSLLLGLTGVWLAFPITELIVTCLGIWLLWHSHRTV